MKKTWIIPAALLAGTVSVSAAALLSRKAEATEKPAASTAPAGHMVSTSAATEELATLRMKFVIDGDAPKPEAIDTARDPFCAQNKIFTDSMLVKDGAIKNVIVYWDARKNKKVDVPKIALEVPKDKPVLDNIKCMFEPKILTVQTGQTIVIKNSDETGHNANFNFFANNPFNAIIPIGGEKELKLEQPEPAPIPIDCNVHPWMKAYIVVSENSYMGVSNDEGVIEIKNLPVGEEFVLKVYHELSGGIDEAVVDGKKEKWRSGRMEIELKAGMNDMGVIKVPASQFED